MNSARKPGTYSLGQLLSPRVLLTLKPCATHQNTSIKPTALPIKKTKKDDAVARDIVKGKDRASGTPARAAKRWRSNGGNTAFRRVHGWDSLERHKRRRWSHVEQTMPVPARLGFRPLSGHQLTSWMVDWSALGGDWLSLVVPLANRLYHSFFLFQLYHGRPTTYISNLNRFGI
ncbi:hypothetical protein Hanom_Chr07g00614961 [Helianthus anomalus]